MGQDARVLSMPQALPGTEAADGHDVSLAVCPGQVLSSDPWQEVLQACLPPGFCVLEADRPVAGVRAERTGLLSYQTY